MRFEQGPEFTHGGTQLEAVASELAASAITVIQEYHDRWEGYSYSINQGINVPSLPSLNNTNTDWGDQAKAEILFPGEAKIVETSGEFPIITRRRFVINEDGLPIDRKYSILRLLKLKRQGIEIKPQFNLG